MVRSNAAGSDTSARATASPVRASRARSGQADAPDAAVLPPEHPLSANASTTTPAPTARNMAAPYPDRPRPGTRTATPEDGDGPAATLSASQVNGPPSSSGLGRRPFTAVTGIRTPLGVQTELRPELRFTGSCGAVWSA